MFCRNCGSQINDGASFCPNCGAPSAGRPAGQPSPATAGGAPYAATAGAPAAAVSTARARRAKSGRKVKVAIIAVAVVAVAAIAVALVLHLLGNPEVTELAQMSGEESGQFLSGLSEFKVDYSDSWYGYATSDEIAAAAAENGTSGSETIEALKESGGSIYTAYADNGSRAVNAQAVSSWDNISGFSEYHVVGEKPDADEVKNIVKRLGGEHMVVYKGSYYLVAAYTIGDGILGTLYYSYDSGDDAIIRSNSAVYSQDGVSTLLAAIQVADLQGADGLKEYLNSSDNSQIYIYSDSDIVYYE